MGNLAANSRAFFVTGTDTEVGKTFFSVGLLSALKAKALTTGAYKPVAAGCTLTSEGWQNDDALALQQACSLELSYAEVNPVALAEPMAPHIAAQKAADSGNIVDMSIGRIQQGFSHILQKQADVVVVEGAGGWRLPLGLNQQGEQSYLSDFVAQQNLAVILVVGMRLGCLNHAILTADSIRQHGLKLAGWVANTMDPAMPCLSENIESLKGLLNAPLIGVIPQLAKPEDAQHYIDLSCLAL
ncbi:dethiobiotin synthase [Paraglaciecola hydrolytica]|uniref:ATP-dependent dethiobiotin synthetase BioD n=1 Tax=Paraglaciecola hydrolytica TaxID=1799789 RepID=A0A136A6C2_9ALTE|nr:dethiobiotin synthase [Paraglaciecola hydrolytica]KXI30761.1 dethiobiotin synthase [Paraglaciecola hydrolytica]